MSRASPRGRSCVDLMFNAHHTQDAHNGPIDAGDTPFTPRE